MPLPDTIPVRYTEEEAGYVTVRPVVRQTFRLEELLDMILSVTGKDAERVRQILHSGTVVYHFFRYSWTGIDAEDAELISALAMFPDPDPALVFAADRCTAVVLDGGGMISRHLLELDRATGSKRKLLRRQSFWDRLLEIAAAEHLAYQSYSYGRRADIYRLDLDGENMSQIVDAANRLAPSKLRTALHVLSGASSILFVCARN